MNNNVTSGKEEEEEKRRLLLPTKKVPKTPLSLKIPQKKVQISEAQVPQKNSSQTQIPQPRQTTFAFASLPATLSLASQTQAIQITPSVAEKTFKREEEREKTK